MPRRRSVLDPLRQDRGHGRRPRGRARRRPADPHRRRAPRRRSAPTSPRSSSAREGTLGVITGARLRVHPAPDARAARRVRVRHLRRRPRRVPPHPAPRRDARRAPPLRRDRGATAATRPATRTCCSCSTRATRRSSTRRWRSSPRSAPARRRAARRELVEHWLEHRNDVSALEALIAQGLRRRHDGDRRPVARRCRAIYERRVAAILGGARHAGRVGHQSHSYPDGACLYFTFAGKPPADESEAVLPRLWDAGTRAVLAARRRALATTTASASTAAASCARRSATAFDVLAVGEAGARPERHPQPRQARPADAVRRGRLAVRARSLGARSRAIIVALRRLRAVAALASGGARRCVIDDDSVPRRCSLLAVVGAASGSSLGARSAARQQSSTPPLIARHRDARSCTFVSVQADRRAASCIATERATCAVARVHPVDAPRARRSASARHRRRRVASRGRLRHEGGARPEHPRRRRRHERRARRDRPPDATVEHVHHRELLPDVARPPGFVEFDAPTMADAALAVATRCARGRRAGRRGRHHEPARVDDRVGPRRPASRSGPASAGRTCAPSAMCLVLRGRGPSPRAEPVGDEARVPARHGRPRPARATSASARSTRGSRGCCPTARCT